MMWYNISDSVYKFYNGKEIYIIETKKRKATVFDHLTDLSPMTGNIAHSIVYEGFLAPEKILEYIDKKNIVSLSKDTFIAGENCYSINIREPNEEEFTDINTQLYIGKKSSLPRLKRSTAKFQGNTQFYELYIKSYKFNSVPTSKYAASQIPPTYKVEVFNDEVQREKSELKLDTNSKMPLISGKFYNNGQIDTINYAGKVTLLDFWYMSCMPCIKAIGEIDKLKKKYQNTTLQIFGINSKDNKPERLKKLPHFLQYNPIGYDILFVDDSVVKQFQIKSWPTFIIVDQYGKLRYQTVGYSEDLADELGKKIDWLLGLK